MALLSDLHPTGRKGIFFREHSTRKHGLRKDRQLVLRYTIGGRTHTEIFGWLSGGRSKAEAELKISEFRTNHKNGTGPVSLKEEREIEESQRAANKERIRKEEEKNITAANFFENVYYPHAKEEKKPDTYETEERLFRLWIKPVIGNLPFAEIAPFHLDKIKANMRKGKREDTYKNSKPRPLSPKSIMHALAVVRQIWNHARRDGIVSGDWPGRDVKKPKFDNRRVRFLDRAEADRLLDELKETSADLYGMALISLHCGLRAGEIFSLTWDCVNENDDTLLLLDTKNNESRIAFVTPTVMDLLKQRKKESTSSDLIFPSRTGGKIRAISAAFARVTDRLGMNNGIKDTRKKVTFHTLRHTYASWLVGEGVALFTVKELLGHKTLSMTARYSHLGENALREATQILINTLEARPSANETSTQVVNIQEVK